MSNNKTLWEKAVEFHGHTCPGLATGYRAAIAGMKALGTGRAPDEELVAIVENDACGVDAVQLITGCTFGKGNLIFHDYGKMVFTFANRTTGKAVRVAVNPLPSAPPAGAQRTPESQAATTKLVLEAPDDVLLTIREVALDEPPKARIFASVQCAFCGERVMEPRARLRDGKVACIPCSEHYPARV